MDAEGSECNILEGAHNLIEKSTELKIIMEWNIGMQRRMQVDLEECMQYLVE